MQVLRRLREAVGIVFSLLLGWWGFPFGPIMASVQVVRNLVGLFSSPELSAMPSPKLEAHLKVRLAKRLQQQQYETIGEST